MTARPVSPEQLAAQRRHWLAMALVLALLAAVALAFAWAFPIAIAWIHSGQVPRLSIPDAIRAVGTGKALSGDPAAAYPPRVRALLPGGSGYWTTAGPTM